MIKSAVTRTLAALALFGAPTACAELGEEDVDPGLDPAYHDPSQPPDDDPDPPEDLEVRAELMVEKDTGEEVRVERMPALEGAEPQAMAVIHGEHMEDWYFTSVWGGWTRAFWADSSRARTWVWAPSRGWRGVWAASWASACWYQPGLSVVAWQGSSGGGSSGWTVGAGYGGHYIGQAYFQYGWNRLELQMWGDQYQPGWCDANVFVDYIVIQ